MTSFEERMSDLLKGHSVSDLAKAYQNLSRRYHQPNYKPGFQNALEVKAYAAARMPATYAVLRRIFSELPIDFSPKTMLDLGAGTGAASIAALQSFPEIQKLTLVEQDQEALTIAKALLSSEQKTDITFSPQNLSQISLHGPVDLIVLSYVLNELSINDQLEILSTLLKSSSQFIIIAMPGTPTCYGQLIILRKFAIEAGYFIAAPCPHHLECPLEKMEGDWCHFSVRLPRTKQHQQFKEASLNFEDEKYSYLLLSKEPIPQAKARLIKKPIHRSGHSLIDVCDMDGQAKRLTISKKDKDIYKKACKAEWGDRI